MKEIKLYLLSIIACLCLGTVNNGYAIFSDIQPVELRCEYLKNPLGLDTPSPRLFWKLEAKNPNARGLKQKAYQILVASSPGRLQDENGDLWNSGRVKSSETTQIEYEGETMRYPMNCWWKVRVADQLGNWSAWSEPAYWTIGPMQSEDWHATWIGTDDVFVPSKDMANPEPSMANPWIRRTYNLESLPQSAMLYVASCGYHEVYVNGLLVGDEILSPSVSDLSHRALYKTYNISSYLQKGTNCIAFWLGVGWGGYEHYATKDKPRTPMVMAQADLVFPGENGDEQIQWLTDESWKTHDSPSYLLGIWMWPSFGGELYDANKEIPEWNSASLDDSSWEKVTVYHPNIKVSANNVEGNQLIGTLKPIRIQSAENGAVKIDMGRNYSGWFRIKMKGKPGSRVVMRWSERPEKENTFFLTSSYIFGPSGEGEFQHRFNYTTGRWITITGLDYLPTQEDISGYFITTAYKRVGSFHCDNELFNRIYDTAMWTFENLSLGGYVVDCPHRERMGYGGDANATIDMGNANYNLAALYYKWATDWRDVQRKDGFVPYTAPTYWGGGGPSYSGFIICMPWKIFLQYGDRRILEETYPAMQHWLEFMEAHSKDDLLVAWDKPIYFIGDWLRPGSTGGTEEETLCMNNCYWVYNLTLAANIADVLGLVNDAAVYRARANKIRTAINKRFYNQNTGSYVSGLQAYQAMALIANVPDKSQRPAVWEQLQKDILVTNQGHIHAGILGGAFLFKMLQQANRNDLIYPMVNTTDYPSWGDMLKQGATTFWEDWEGNGSKNHSLLHSSYLYVGNWFIEGLGGIKAPQIANDNGFQHFFIEPGYLPNQNLKKVESSYDSIRGKIVCNWEVRHNKMFVKVVIPPNSTATMRVPASLEKVFESAEPLNKCEGISIPHVRENLFDLESGTYQFEIWLK